MEQPLISENDLLRTALIMRETRRAYFNQKKRCDRFRLEGYAPRQYEEDLKKLNDLKSAFFASVQRVLDAADREKESER